MKYVSTALIALAAFTSTQSMAIGQTAVVSSTGVEIVSHSGGCRKSSPAGQCCHAGSQPLHCH